MDVEIPSLHNLPIIQNDRVVSRTRARIPTGSAGISSGLGNGIAIIQHHPFIASEIPQRVGRIEVFVPGFEYSSEKGSTSTMDGDEQLLIPGSPGFRVHQGHGRTLGSLESEYSMETSIIIPRLGQGELRVSSEVVASWALFDHPSLRGFH